METIEEWMEAVKDISLGSAPGKSQKNEIRWTGKRVDRIKIIYAAYHSKQINDGTVSITEICLGVLEFFSEKFPEKDNTLSSVISSAKKNGHTHFKFLESLKIGF